MRILLRIALSVFSLSQPLLYAATQSPAPDGRALYLRWCSECHGQEGKGDGIKSTPDRRVNPANHTDASYMSTRTDKQLEDAIRGGGLRVAKSPMMPGWEGKLTSQEIKALVAYLRILCKCTFEGLSSDEKLRKIDSTFR